MVAPIINMPNTTKHNGNRISTQILWLHSAECPLQGGYAQSLTQWAQQPHIIASWHRFVDPIARVRQVPDHLAAWTQGWGNPFGIGWEQAGYAGFTRAQWETPAGLKQMENLAYDMAEVAKRHGIPARWLTTDEVQAVCFRGNRTIKGFAIHAQIAADRTDPGPNFPYEKLTARVAKLNAVPVPKPAPVTPPVPPKTYYVPNRHWRVDPGDTLGAIAAYYGDATSAIASYNGIRNPNDIRVGEIIWPRDGMGTWRVDPGDTASKIVNWVRTHWNSTYTLDDLMWANGLNNPSRISVGQRFQIQKKR